jgi:hypothetical protein
MELSAAQVPTSPANYAVSVCILKHTNAITANIVAAVVMVMSRK